MEDLKVMALVALYLIIASIAIGFIGQALDILSRREDEEGEGGEDEED